jgi:phage repressor protein C with HTH and peptisase S24 domain
MDSVQTATRRYVAAVLRRTGWSATELARRCAMAPSTLNRFLHNERVTHALSARSLMKIAEASGVELPIDLGGVADAAGLAQGGSLGALPGGARASGFGARRDLPVRGRAQGGPDGAVMLDAEPIDWTWRPAELQGARDAFAMFVTGDSMGEVLREGATIFVHPSLPPRPGDFVVVEKTDHQALIKRLVRRADTGLVLRQYNPPRDFELSRADVLAIYRVIGTIFP